VSSGDGINTGPVLALEPLSTPGNYRHLQRPQALDRPTLFLGDRFQEHTVPRRGDSAQEALQRQYFSRSTKCIKLKLFWEVGIDL
jgi:hypothetical protein